MFLDFWSKVATEVILRRIIERLRSRFFSISREPRTSARDVTKFEVRVWT